MKPWVVFDAMGVIFDEGDDHNRLLVPYVRDRNPSADPRGIVDAYMQASLGAITPREFWTRVGLGAAYPAVESGYLDTRPVVCAGAVELADHLKGSVSLALLSNDINEWSVYLRNKYDLDRLFEVTVISSEAGCRKPSAHIFETLLKRTGARPADVLLLDDSDRNIEAARGLG